MNLVFFGTPDFTIPILEKIKSSHHNILAIVTAPDKERGRGRQKTYTPVKEYAIKNDILCLQPEKMNDDTFINQLKQINADIFVVVAFRILPKSVYSIPAKGSFNLHGSLLPKYRGAAPIQWALINGDKKTGVTTFFLDDKVDTGKIIDFTEIEIEQNDNFGSLHDKLSKIGAELVLETLNKIENNQIELKQQNDSEATIAPKITKELSEINWNMEGYRIINLLKGLTPYLGLVFNKDSKKYKVYDMSIAQNNNLSLKVGEFYSTKTQIFVGAKDSTLEIKEIQAEGKKRLKTEEFLRGNTF